MKKLIFKFLPKPILNFLEIKSSHRLDILLEFLFLVFLKIFFSIFANESSSIKIKYENILNGEGMF
jgi:hypothetical protein